MKFENSATFRSIRSSLTLLSSFDQKRMIWVAFIQFMLSLLDLIGVVFLGILGTLTISGKSYEQLGNRTQQFLQLIGVSNLNLRYQIIYLGIASAIILVVKTFVSLYFTRRILFYLSRKAAQVSSQLLKRLLSFDILTINRRSIQETIYCSTTGVQTVMVGILGTAMTLLSDFILLLILLIGLFLTDLLTATLSLFIFTLIALLLFFIMKSRVTKIQSRLTKSLISTNERTNEVINSFRELFSKGRQFFYSEKIGQLRLLGADSSAELTFLGNINKYVIELTLIFGTLLIIGVQFATQTATHAIAVLSIFIVSATRIAPAVLRIQQGILSMRASAVAAQLTFDLLDEVKGDLKDLELSKKLPDLKYEGFQPTISLRNLHFTYPANNHFKIQDLNLYIQTGQVLALVGTSGSGKTTLVDLFLGILQPTQGQVLISGTTPIDSIREWPGAIAYVPQDVFISNGTIRENVTLGYDPKDFPDSVIDSAIETAQLSTLVKNSTNGLDTHIGERGTKISGGQRQRIGIARALLTQPKLLVLDEATSSLDSETEANLTEAIRKLRGKSTLVLIAHRLSTVKEADIVVYMENGKVIATGKFEEVRAKVPNFDKQAQLMGL